MIDVRYGSTDISRLHATLLCIRTDRRPKQTKVYPDDPWQIEQVSTFDARDFYTSVKYTNMQTGGNVFRHIGTFYSGAAYVFRAGQCEALGILLARAAGVGEGAEEDNILTGLLNIS